MAVKIIANYSKRLGLPSYSSHQFSLSVEVELSNPSDVQTEAARLYKNLQSAVDREIQNTGFIPSEEYGVESGNPAPARLPASRNSGAIQWKASDKQRELILKIVEDNQLELEVVEAIAEEMFGTSSLPSLNKIQSSGLIDELLARYGTKPRRAAASNTRWSSNRRAS
ncbi:MAG: hypothetical protein WCO60_07090 [Verrucomicrobiota bacterium]